MAASNPPGFYKLLNKNVPHIIEKIFLYLDYESYIKCHEVCDAWSKILETESIRRRSKALYHDEMVDDLFKATKARNIKQITRLLSIGININVTKFITKYSIKTPLIEALSTWSQMNDVVKILLNAGADPNQADNWGYSPLHFAAAYGNTYAIKLLLDQGANPNQVNSWGKTALTHALDWIIDREPYNVTRDVIKMLMDGGIQANEQDRGRIDKAGFLL